MAAALSHNPSREHARFATKTLIALRRTVRGGRHNSTFGKGGQWRCFGSADLCSKRRAAGRVLRALRRRVRQHRFRAAGRASIQQLPSSAGQTAAGKWAFQTSGGSEIESVCGQFDSGGLRQSASRTVDQRQQLPPGSAAAHPLLDFVQNFAFDARHDTNTLPAVSMVRDVRRFASVAHLGRCRPGATRRG